MRYRRWWPRSGQSRWRPQAGEAADGSWPNPPGDNEAAHGPVYATSMAVLALAMRQGVLPAYQR